tara:strand:+ start:483 stop:698 length:216 start_codon:yes stop_codon:yes gene_type:complete
MPEISNELMDMIAKDESPSNISNKIKDLLFAKSAEKIDAVRPEIASSMFDEPETKAEVEADDAPAEEEEEA